MPGAYLAAIVVSMLGMGLIDRRFRLALWAPGSAVRTLIAVAIGTIVLIIVDIVAISQGVFVQGAPHGQSPLYLGVDLGPELPIEELFFLAFLCYLALVITAGAQRVVDAVRAAKGSRQGGAP